MHRKPELRGFIWIGTGAAEADGSEFRGHQDDYWTSSSTTAIGEYPLEGSSALPKTPFHEDTLYAVVHFRLKKVMMNTWPRTRRPLRCHLDPFYLANLNNASERIFGSRVCPLDRTAGYPDLLGTQNNGRRPGMTRTIVNSA